MQIIFQDPYASLNPRLTIEQTLTEPMEVHKIESNQSDRTNLAVSLLEEVGLESAHPEKIPPRIFLVGKGKGFALPVHQLPSRNLLYVMNA